MLCGACALVAALSGAGRTIEDSTEFKRLDVKHLPNAIRIHRDVISGGLPDGDAGFKELGRLGVKTVISVDGLKPDVEAAKRHGLRYVHLPHGYDSVPQKRVAELAKAITELPGPVYIHCHHGKHRSPAAAATACIAAGSVKPEQGQQILRFAGTSSQYRGLYKSVRDTQRIPASKLRVMKVQFREIVPLPPIVEAMTKMESTLEGLERLSSNGWKPRSEEPDRTAAHEALMLKELLTEFGRDPEAKRRPEGFRELITESETIAGGLLDAIRSSDQADAAKQVKSIRRRCVECHQRFRD